MCAEYLLLLGRPWRSTVVLQQRPAHGTKGRHVIPAALIIYETSGFVDCKRHSMTKRLQVDLDDT